MVKINKNDNDVFDDIFEEENKKEKVSDLEILKELFDSKDVKTKTELSAKQINIMNSKRMISKMLNWERLEESLDDFMQLSISKDRKGRIEFVDGFKAQREKDLEDKGNTFLGNLKGKLGF